MASFKIDLGTDIAEAKRKGRVAPEPIRREERPRTRPGKIHDKDYSSFIRGLFDGSVSIHDDEMDDVNVGDIINEENEFDLVKLVSKSVDPLTGVPRDIKVPEGDFKESPNFFDFCSNYRGPNAKFPFSRQMWFMSTLFCEICPRCTPKKFQNIMNIPVGLDPQNMPNRIQFMNFGKCPRCGATKYELIKSGEMNEYMELALCVGQRAGKSTTVAAGMEYLLHKYLMYPRMSSVCRGVSSTTPLVATFVGFRFADAMSLLWKPIMDGIKDSPWFQDYHKMLEHYGEKHGIEFYRMKDIYLRYGIKNLELYPSGPTKRGLRGRTRFAGGTDELGWWPLQETEDDEMERADGNGVYDALDRSLLTLRTEISDLYAKGYDRFLQAYNLNVSSPSSQGDKINRLVEENKDSKTNLALRLATWEVSPIFTRENKIIVDAYKKNAVNAERDYGANPPLNAAVFIQMEAAVRAFIGKNQASIATVEKNIQDKWRQAGKVERSAPSDPAPATLMSMDAGLVNNSFAATFLELKALKVGDVKSYTINVPVLVEIQPKPGHMLHYPMIYRSVLKPLMQDFNTRFMFADRWNSITTLDTAMEDFAGRNLIAKQYSVKYNDFITTRSYLEEGKLILPKLEMPVDEIRRVDEYPTYFFGKPAAHLLFQMITVRDRGKTVIKGENYTDDIFRALVLGVSRILDEKIKDEIIRISALSTKPFLTGAIASPRTNQYAAHANMSPRGGRTVLVPGGQINQKTGERSSVVVRLSR